MEKISDRFAAIHGFLIKTDRDGTKRITCPNISSLKPTKKELQRILELKLQNLAVYLGMKEDLIYVDCPLLFETVTSEQRYFNSTEDGMKAVRSGRTNSANTRRSIEYRVLPITLPNKTRKYLCQTGKKLPEMPLEHEIATPHQESEAKTATVPQTSEDLDVFHTLHCDKLVFTKRDRRLFRSFAMDRTLYEVESVAILKHCYREAISKTTKTNSFGEPLVTKYKLETLEIHGKHAGVLLFLIANLHQLSLGQQVERPTVDSELLLDRIGELHNTEAKAAHLQQLLYIVLKEERYMDLANLFTRLLLFRLSAHYDIRKDLEVEEMETVRERMSAMGVWIKCVIISEKSEDQLNVFQEESHNIWSKFTTLYHKVAKESDQTMTMNINRVPPDCIRVYGKTFGREYIRSFYSDMQYEFDQQWSKLDRVLTMTPVESTGKMLLENYRIPGAGHGYRANFSLKDMFPQWIHDQVSPSMRQPLTQLDKREVLGAIDKMTVALMWMIWLAAGVPYTFSELQVLACGGDQQNIYVDSERRCVQIITRSFKKWNLKEDFKWLDKRTSYYLVYYVTVLRKTQISVLGENYEAFEPPKEGEVDLEGIWEHIEGKCNMSKKVASALIMDQYLFLDAKLGQLMSRRRFLKLSEEHPNYVASPERLSFKQLKFGRMGLLRQYLASSLNDSKPVKTARIDLAMCRFAASSARDYMDELGDSEDVDDPDVMGDLEVLEESMWQCEQSERFMTRTWHEEIAKQWIRWVGLDEEEEIHHPLTYSVGEIVLQKEALCPDDLVHAGRELYGKSFTFRNSDQYLACVNAYLSNKKIIAVQAPPGLGKTLVFQLPLMCYTMRKLSLVSFVFVPFVGLLAGTRCRLKASGNLRVGSVEKLLNETRRKENSLLDVYVGTFNDAAAEDFIKMINFWSLLYPEKKLGLLAFDEFQNLYDEKSHSEVSFPSLKRIQFERFRRIILTSATCEQGSAQGALQELGFRGLEGTNFTWERSQAGRSVDVPIFLRNYVQEPAVMHVYKHALRMRGNGVGQAKQFLKSLFAYDPDAKAALVVGENEATTELFTEVSQEFSAAYVHGDLTTEEKLKRVQSFIKDKSLQLLIGTKQVVEGLDIEGLRMVILLDYYPRVAEYIQCVGRVRGSGTCIALWQDPPPQVENDLPRVDYDKCFTSQICKYYELPQRVHTGCCGSFESVTEETKSLFHRVVLEEEVYDGCSQKTARDEDSEPGRERKIARTDVIASADDSNEVSGVNRRPPDDTAITKA